MTFTGENVNLNNPFFLRPAAKDYLWGGSRLNDDFSKGIDLSPLAETWEGSTHPDGVSMVASGEYEGQNLLEVIKSHPEYLGTHPKNREGLPILVKLIDAKLDLSVQVHPNDEYAFKYENGQQGKTEMWYVLDADPNAELVYGFNKDMTKDKVRDALNSGKIEKYLQKVKVKKDDVFYIEAGIVHAIGGGILVAEIQENSNLTYRLYDYDREDKNGRKRELHIDKALEVANLKSSKEPRQPLRVLRYIPGCAKELLCRCEYFEVYRMLINTERCRSMVDFKSDELSFRILLCTDGCGSIRYDDKFYDFFKGDCIFVPASSVDIKIHGQAQFLDIRG